MGERSPALDEWEKGGGHQVFLRLIGHRNASVGTSPDPSKAAYELGASRTATVFADIGSVLFETVVDARGKGFAVVALKIGQVHGIRSRGDVRYICFRNCSFFHFLPAPDLSMGPTAY